MNYLLTLWAQFWCTHNWKYCYRTSYKGACYEIFECQKCMKAKYEHHHDDDISIKDLGKP